MALILVRMECFGSLFAQFYETGHIFTIYMCTCAIVYSLPRKIQCFFFFFGCCISYDFLPIVIDVQCLVLRFWTKIIAFIRMNFQFTFKVFIFVQKNLGKMKRSLNSIPIIVCVCVFFLFHFSKTLNAKENPRDHKRT